ncbi:unnamed protein product, partial [Linum tenue]
AAHFLGPIPGLLAGYRKRTCKSHRREAGEVDIIAAILIPKNWIGNSLTTHCSEVLYYYDALSQLRSPVLTSQVGSCCNGWTGCRESLQYDKCQL